MIIPHCLYIDKQAIIMREKIISQYQDSDWTYIQCLNIAEDIIKNNLIQAK